VVFGATFSGRSAELDDVESIVGPFVNNLPVRVQLPPDITLARWFERLQEQQLELSRFQHTPLTKIQEWSAVPLRYRMFESLIVFQNYVVGEATTRLGDQIAIDCVADPQHTNYPLTIIGIPQQELVLRIIYRRDHFDADTITTILQDFRRMLEGMVAATTQPLAALMNGNIAWKAALPGEAAVSESAETHSKMQPAYMVPRTEVERAIAKVWQEAFGIDTIGLRDNFFDLGGHSLMLVAVHQQLQEVLHTTFPVTRMFQYSTVSALADYLSKGQGDMPAYDKVRDRARRQREALIGKKQLKARSS
jgi:acyl carrier protein